MIAVLVLLAALLGLSEFVWGTGLDGRALLALLLLGAAGVLFFRKESSRG